MFRWADFEAAAPGLASKGRELFEPFRFVLAGTIRRDGTPRISAVEAHVVAGHLMLVMIPATLKAHDVVRDPRIVLNSPVMHPDDPNAEFKLRGRVVEVDDPALTEATAGAIEAASGWRPPGDWLFLAIDVESAAFLAWKGGELRLTRWSRDDGLEHVTKPVAILD